MRDVGRWAAVVVGTWAMGMLVTPDAAAQFGRRPSSPGMTLPTSPQEPDQPDVPLFRAEVTRVEVSVLVLDSHNAPVRGLRADDFEIFENGERQVVRSFTPYTHDPGLLILPDPTLEDVPGAVTASAPASNYYASASRVFALILDDLHVDVRRTQVAREAARRLLAQLEPSDLLFVITTSSGESTGFFSRDRRHARTMIDRFMGQRLRNWTVERRREGPGVDGVQHDDTAGRYDHYLRLNETLRNVSLALRDVNGRRKSVVLLSEGSSFGAGIKNMVVRMPKATDRQRVNSTSGTLRLMNETLAAAAAGNVAIYPLNPAGLGREEADLLQGFGAVDEKVLTAVLTEAQQSKEMLRDVAALTGGVAFVDTNDPGAAVDRVVRDASVHYVLTYEPERPAKGDEYRTIDVKVKRPGLRVLARRGYRAPAVRPPPALKTPESLPPNLRRLLAGVVPEDGLAMRVEAVPLRRRGSRATVALIVEVNGSILLANDQPLELEQGVLSIDGAGQAHNGERRAFALTLSPRQREVLAASSLRTVWAMDLPAGRHQLRVATIDRGTGRGGSVYLDLQLPRTGLPAGALVSSRFLSMMPTAFVDERLQPWAERVPTATRVFPQGDVLTVTVPHDTTQGHARARLVAADGRTLWEGEGTPIDAHAARLVVALDQPEGDVGTLLVESSHGAQRIPLVVLAPPAGDPSIR